MSCTDDIESVIVDGGNVVLHYGDKSTKNIGSAAYWIGSIADGKVNKTIQETLVMILKRDGCEIV